MFQRMFSRRSANGPAVLRPAQYAVLMLLPMCAGCIDMAQQEYDMALQQVTIEQQRLDTLRPAYDTARQTARLAVFKEITGGTPEETTLSTLQQLGDLAASANKQPEGDKKGDEIDRAIDQLTAMQNAIQSTQGALGGSGKVNEVMTKINTPGTPEAKRFEDVLAAMPEVQAYERQQKRLEQAAKAVLEAEAKLPDGAKNAK